MPNRARSVVAWVAVAPFAVWAAWRILGLADGGGALKVIALTPFAAAGSVFAVGLALLLRRRVAALVAAAACIALGVTVLPRALPNGDPEITGGEKLTVMSLNLDSGKADATQIAEMVSERDVDVLVLLELRPALERLRAAGVLEELPEAVTADSRAGGSAVLSRRPLQTRPREPLAGAEQEPSVRLDLGEATVDLTATHPPHPTDDVSEDQWREYLEALPDARGAQVPQLVIGDLNATLDHGELSAVLDRGYRDAADATGAGLSMTWPTDRLLPLVAIDHVLADERLGILDFDAEPVRDTDHKAVIATVLVPPE